MARAVMVAVLLMQLCNVILTARPLLVAVADGGRATTTTGHGTEELAVMLVLNGPGSNCKKWQAPNDPPCQAP
ncbi:unnamed protein product [Miscanthus lutarioriparius]|uniref:Uncharacterized protein n=1 Tax=Miscanthus lutarioriparius TaxID=422564 RepID=A0A811M6N9_9POAL|nr:unnamed protein product [Miscanthus lutarioriparius]CAD6202182.1 unnamed protein product [Miscanthus lutarioriparius]CAD6202190.1 unnamed protein product [Miscanthus lutarioriparius]CAD6202192.1 unnamed protein product [Miscanthus lutarioriparius]